MHANNSQHTLSTCAKCLKRSFSVNTKNPLFTIILFYEDEGAEAWTGNIQDHDIDFSQCDPTQVSWTRR